jgi:hypothetical protein
MSLSQADGDILLQFDHEHLYDATQKAVDGVVRPFSRAVRIYVLFHLFFLTLMTVEIVVFCYGMAWMSHSSTLAINLAVIFLTVFSYFIIKVYLQTKKPSQFLLVRNRFVAACKSLVGYQHGVPEHHLAIASACGRAATTLQGIEGRLYQPPRWLSFFEPLLERFSFWWHWEDVFRIRELFLLWAVQEYVELVKCAPTTLDGHIALANAYVMLTSLYVPQEAEEQPWMLRAELSEELDRKFRASAERAMEEFKILNDYAPDDPWIHSQLAYSYRDLQMPEEEIRENETVLMLRPGDQDVLYRLGVLYFQQGHNAKGLRVYEELRHGDSLQAESLIRHYGV